MKVLFCLLLLVAVSHQHDVPWLQFLCYSCSLEPFEPGGCFQQACDVPNARCFKHIVKTDSKEETYRGCTYYGSDDGHCANVKSRLGQNQKLAYCDTCGDQLCNDSIKISSSVGLVALVVAARQLVN